MKGIIGYLAQVSKKTRKPIIKNTNPIGAVLMIGNQKYNFIIPREFEGQNQRMYTKNQTIFIDSEQDEVTIKIKFAK